MKSSNSASAPRYDKGDVLAALDGRWAGFYGQYTPLKPLGGELRGPCPLHGGDGPNFSVNPDGGLWTCFSGCQDGGDAFDFLRLKERLEFPDALAFVAEWAGVRPEGATNREASRPTPMRPIPDANTSFLDAAIAETLHDKLMATDSMRLWLSEHRGLTSETLTRFRLGMQKDDQGLYRITFPILDRQGRLINVRRHLFAYKEGLDRKFKTLPWEKGLTPGLFPLSALDGADDALIVEGEADAALACQMGFAAVSGTLGAGNWKPQWTEELRRMRRVTLLYDADGPGQEGAQKVAAALAPVIPDVRLARVGEGKDLTEWAVEHGATAADVQKAIGAAVPFHPSTVTVEGVWEAPVPFADASLPPFPLDALPPCLADFVSEVAASVQVPVDMAALMALGIVAAAGARTCLVSVGETHHEPLNLFVAVVMEPGSRKSGTLDALAAPLREAERELLTAQMPQITEATEKRAVEEKRLAHLRDMAAKAKNGDEAADRGREVADLAGSLTPVPAAPRLLADDLTPEAAAKIAGEQGGTLAIVSAEGGLFANLGGRYQNGQPNLDLFLHGHAGESHRVDRKGSPPVFIARVCLTVLLAIQPGVLASLSETPAFGERGLVARFLFSIPQDLVGTRFYSNRRIDPAARSAYHRAIKAIVGLPAPATEADPGARHLLQLEGPALKLWADYADDIERRQAEGGDLRPLKYWASKLAGAVARIAGGLHLAQHAGHVCPWAVPISPQTVAAAWAVGEYLLPHAQVAYGDMGEGADAKTARRLLKWVLRLDLTEFTLRECHQAHRSLSLSDLKTALSLLCDRGFLRLREEPKRGMAGRPKGSVYQCNPLTQNTQNTQK